MIGSPVPRINPPDPFLLNFRPLVSSSSPNPASKNSQAFPGKGKDLLPQAFRDLKEGELLVNEFFTSIQGESTFQGQPCFFIRLTGCHLRCVYCDTEYAFYQGQKETVETCLERAHQAQVQLVEVTGGEPLLQASCNPLLSRLCDDGFTVLLETSGCVPLHRVDERVHRIIDVKTPSSQMDAYNLKGLEDQLRSQDEIKFVVDNPEDYEWTRAWIQDHPKILDRGIPIHISPCEGKWKLEELAQKILDDRLPVRLNLQLHKLIWPDREQGI